MFFLFQFNVRIAKDDAEAEDKSRGCSLGQNVFIRKSFTLDRIFAILMLLCVLIGPDWGAFIAAHKAGSGHALTIVYDCEMDSISDTDSQVRRGKFCYDSPSVSFSLEWT